MPILNVSVVDTNPTTKALTGDDSVLIKYHSNALATMTMQYGEIIDDTCIIENGENKVKKVSSTTFENVENNYFVFKCENTQFIHFKKELTAPMVDYVKLTCNVLPSSIDGAGNVRIACYGNAFFDSFGAEENEIVAKCRIRKNTGSYGAWNDMEVSKLTDTSYLASVDLQVSDYEGQYIAEIVVSDKLETVTKTETKASKPIFHWGASDFKFEVPVTAPSMQVYDELRLKPSNKNYGTYLRFGDGSSGSEYCYIAELSDDNMTIYALNDIDLKTKNGNVYINGSLAGGSGESGEWTPELNDSAVSDYYSQQGWYNRVGNTVTVGFIIKADCNSGYQSTAIEISGLPFTPSYSAAGGGMCSGAYVSGGYNFQCFVAETDGTITTRVQQCNNTSATNLSTSASGCNYRNGGGTLTMSGTITYLTEK